MDMSFMELSQKRYSVRDYAPQPVEEEKLAQILEAGRLAPTAANRQPQKIYLLQSEEAMQKARQVTPRMMYNAPMALLVCYDDTVSWKATEKTFGEEYEGGEVDAAIVTTAMMMQATELGIGSLWVRGFPSYKASEIFQLPANIHPVCFLVLGYPAADTIPPKNRKALEEMVERL
jgi:nitroreductase